MSVERLHASDKLPSTVTRIEFIECNFFFPENIEGLRILDIGAGVTTVPRSLRERGALPIAMDIRYSDSSKLKESSEKALSEVNEILERSELEATRKRKMGMFREIQKEALKDLKSNPGYYVTGSMFDLPFADNTFDFVFSSMCIDRVGDYEDFLHALTEAYRVTASGGEVQIAPFDLTTLLTYGFSLQDRFRSDLVELYPSDDLVRGLLRVRKV